MLKYELMDCKDAKEAGYLEEWARGDEWEYCLIRTDENGTTSIFIDGIEPEDASLTRDLNVFYCELDRLAGIINELRAKNG